MDVCWLPETNILFALCEDGHFLLISTAMQAVLFKQVRVREGLTSSLM